MDVTLLIIVTIISVAYFFYSLKDGVPESLSATYYTLGKKGWLFQLVMFLTGACLLPVWMSVSEEGYRFLAFLSCASLMFVAAAPCFKMELEGKVHYVSASICCVGLVLWQVFNASWLVPFVCFMLVIVPIKKDGKKTWWMEVATIVSAYTSLIIFY